MSGWFSGGARYVAIRYSDVGRCAFGGRPGRRLRRWPAWSCWEEARSSELRGALRRLHSGTYYALELMKRLALEGGGGAVRMGFVHSNTAEEVERLLGDLAALE
jgi:hypothetical protein